MPTVIPLYRYTSSHQIIIITLYNVKQTSFKDSIFSQSIARWLGGVAVRVGFVIERLRVRFPAVPPIGATLGKLFTHMCLCSPSSMNWYRLRLGVKCTTGAVLGMLAAIRRTLRLAANRRHSSPASFLPVVAVVQRP